MPPPLHLSDIHCKCFPYRQAKQCSGRMDKWRCLMSAVQTYPMGHFTFWISPSLHSALTHRPQGVIIVGVLKCPKIFIIINIIDNWILNFLDCILIGIFHWENVLNGGHFERREASNTFIFSEILPACAKEYLAAAMYYCQVGVKVCDRIAAVDAIFPPICCSDKQ